MNNQGFSHLNDIDKGELTHVGTSIPAEKIRFNENTKVNSVPFKFMRNKDNKDNVELEGQLIQFPSSNVRKIHFLSLSCYGSYFQEVKLLNDNNPVSQSYLYTTELAMEAPEYEQIYKGISFDYLHNRKGEIPNLQGNIWHSYIDIGSTREINQIKFEDNPAIHIFAITLEGEGSD